MPTKNNPNEIYITRVYNAPLKTVWEAWVDPAQVAKWWGPRGFTITTKSKDVRVGGSWDYTMHGPNGVDFPNFTKFLEVDTHARLVYDHGGNAERPPMFRVTVLFSEQNGRTTMDMTMALPTAEAATATKKFIKQASGDSTWDRLAEYLDKEVLGRDTFVIHRSFDTSIETLFNMWTHPEHLAAWLPPTGATMKFIRANIQVGQSSFYSMPSPAGPMFGRAEYLEITQPTRIVYTQQFCDENEKIIRHPMAPTWPETMLTTVTLSEEGPSQTRVALSWEAHGKVLPAELEVFLSERAGMTQGWTGSFDKLDEYLLKL